MELEEQCDAQVEELDEARQALDVTKAEWDSLIAEINEM